MCYSLCFDTPQQCIENRLATNLEAIAGDFFKPSCLSGAYIQEDWAALFYPKPQGVIGNQHKLM